MLEILWQTLYVAPGMGLAPEIRTLDPQSLDTVRAGTPAHARWLLFLLLHSLLACGPQDELSISTHVGDWRDEVVYQIVVDRFDNADPHNDRQDGVGTVPGDLARHQGGDWAGVTRRLDHLRRLGVTAIWISPVVQNIPRLARQDGYHGYWASDFATPNPRFGTLEELRRLVRKAHQQGIKVIVDVVTNHTGRLFFYDFDADGSAGHNELEPPFSNQGPHRGRIVWHGPRPRLLIRDPSTGLHPPRLMPLQPQHFHRRGQTENFTSQHQKEYGDFPTGLRDIDTERPDVVDAMVDTTVWWVLNTDIDGIRLDAVPHVPHQFWARYSRGLREQLARHGKHRFLILGEAYHRDPRYMASYTGRGGLDAVFDFSLKWELIDGFLLDGKPAATARPALEQNRALYPAAGHPGGVGLAPWQARVAFADNHDMCRVRGELDDPRAAELAMTVVFTVDAIPSIYYGTEQELRGCRGDASREPLWRSGFSTQTRMFRHLARLAAIRRSSTALRRGTLVVRHASAISARRAAPDAGLLVYERFTGQERVLVALNGHPWDHAAATLPTGFAAGTELRDRLGAVGQTVTVATDGTIRLRLPPRAAAILIPESL